MGNYLQPEDDGLPVRESGAWARDKLFYLQKYINAFETSMRGKPWRRRIYIDLFAGPGKGLIRETKEYVLGSPLVALTTAYPFTDYYFVDKDPTNKSALEKRSKASVVPEDRIHCMVGDANERVAEVVDEIRKIDGQYLEKMWSSLNLAFLDPEGFELEWKTVAELAKVSRMDLVIHYSQQGVKRMADRALLSDNQTAIDRFFGGIEWRQIYASCKDDPTGVHGPLIDYYKSRLQQLGYVEVKDNEEVWADPLMRNRNNAPLYRLLFASKDALGLKFWKEVTKVGTDGQLPLWK